MGDLMQTNNKLIVQKDNEFKENQKWINELKIVRGTNDELKSLLKEKESHWVSMSKDTLRINEDGIKKLEELKRSEEDLIRTKRALEDDMMYLRKRNGELEQMEVERETDLKVKISEVQVGFGEKMLFMERQNDDETRKLEQKWESGIFSLFFFFAVFP